MMKFHFTLMLLIFLITQDVYAQLYVENQTSKPVWLTLAYNYVPDDANSLEHNTWITEGWFYIAPFQKAEVSSYTGFKKNTGTKTNFFYYAYQEDGREWKGPRKFLLDANPPAATGGTDFRMIEAHKIDLPLQPDLYMKCLKQVCLFIPLPPVHPPVPQLAYGEFKGGTQGKLRTETLVLRQDDKNDPRMTREKKSAFW